VKAKRLYRDWLGRFPRGDVKKRLNRLWRFVKGNLLTVSVLVAIGIAGFQWGNQEHRSNVFEAKLSWLVAHEVLGNYAWLQSKHRHLIALREEVQAAVETPDLLRGFPELYGMTFNVAVGSPLETESMGIALANVNVFSRSDFIRIGSLYEAIRIHRAQQQRTLRFVQDILEQPFISIEDAHFLLSECDHLVADNVRMRATIEAIYKALRWDRRFVSINAWWENYEQSRE